MVISLPTKKNIKIDVLKQSSQTFHRDLVSKNFFKAFIFLSDINKNDGSHVYLEGSHKKNFNDETNKNDLSIETIYKDYKKKEISGKKGDLFFGDTFCLHKGSNPKNNYRLLLILTFFTVLFSAFGDLFISLIKRRSGKKDTGNILPGHGGILDRVDSLLSAAPVFLIFSYFLSAIIQ